MGKIYTDEEKDETTGRHNAMTNIYEDTGERVFEVISPQSVVENIVELRRPKKVSNNPSVLTRQNTSDAKLPEIYI